jgi:hypothetical protein
MEDPFTGKALLSNSRELRPAFECTEFGTGERLKNFIFKFTLTYKMHEAVN